MKAFGSFFLLKYFVKRLFGVAACQRVRQATFWRRCEPAAPSSDFFALLRASGPVKRLFGAAACQRLRQATFWRRCVPASPSSDFLASLGASGLVKRHSGVAFDPETLPKRHNDERAERPYVDLKKLFGIACISPSDGGDARRHRVSEAVSHSSRPRRR